jgi:hypothetical protein
MGFGPLLGKYMEYAKQLADQNARHLGSYLGLTIYLKDLQEIKGELAADDFKFALHRMIELLKEHEEARNV